jgi:hypothetical protein
MPNDTVGLQTQAMPLDFSILDALRTHHPAWRLLRSDHAPLVASFLHRVFVVPLLRMDEGIHLPQPGRMAMHEVHVLK